MELFDEGGANSGVVIADVVVDDDWKGTSSSMSIREFSVVV